MQGIGAVQSFWRDFEEHLLPGLEELHIAGGEPLVMAEHYELLEKLIAARKTSLELYYDTNLSCLHYKHWDVMSLWRPFPRLRLSLSLDGVGAEGEYIRHGLNYARWADNVAHVKRELPHARRELHFVVSILNILSFRLHYDTIVREVFVDPGNITVTFLECPRYLSIQALHPALKKRVEHSLNDMIEHDGLLDARTTQMIRAMIAFMRKRDLYATHGEEFVMKTRLLDRRRGEDTFQMMPGLQTMLHAEDRTSAREAIAEGDMLRRVGTDQSAPTRTTHRTRPALENGPADTVALESRGTGWGCAI